MEGLGFQITVGAPEDKVTGLERHMDQLLGITKDPATNYSYVHPVKDAPVPDTTVWRWCSEDQGAGNRRHRTAAGDTDFDLLLRAAEWFAGNAETQAGLFTPRRVPVEGLHAKWLNTSQHLVRELAGLEDLGLLPPHPARIHFTCLDPEHLASRGQRHD